MNKIKELHKNIMDSYGSKLKSKLYKDKNFDSKGINYSDFICLKFESINKGHIKDKYTVNGWYILWYLMANAQHKSYIKTTFSMIAKDIQLSEKIIKTTLFHLDELGVIKVICTTQSGKDKVREQIKASDTLEITIVYNHSEYCEDKGYRALPTEWVKSIISTVSAKAWAILTALIVKYNFFTKLPPTNEGVYPYNINHYAFPTYDQMSELTGISKGLMRELIEELKDSKYSPIQTVNMIEKEEDDKKKKKSMVFRNGKYIWENYCYEIELLSRIEYHYYHTYLQNKEDIRDFNKLIGTSGQYELTDIDYIINNNPLLKHYNKAIKEKDITWYDTYNKNDMTIQKYNK